MVRATIFFLVRLGTPLCLPVLPLCLPRATPVLHHQLSIKLAMACWRFGLQNLSPRDRNQPGSPCLLLTPLQNLLNNLDCYALWNTFALWSEPLIQRADRLDHLCVVLWGTDLIDRWLGGSRALFAQPPTPQANVIQSGAQDIGEHHDRPWERWHEWRQRPAAEVDARLHNTKHQQQQREYRQDVICNGQRAFEALAALLTADDWQDKGRVLPPGDQ